MSAVIEIDTRLLRLTDSLIAKGVNPTEAANIAAKTLLEGSRLPKPWLSPEETAKLLDMNLQTIYRGLLAESPQFKGARKFCNQWRIPAATILPS